MNAKIVIIKKNTSFSYFFRRKKKSERFKCRYLYDKIVNRVIFSKMDYI